MKDKELADKMIKIMQDAGFTPDQMLECLKLAREKYEQLKKARIKCSLTVRHISAVQLN